MGLSKKLKFLLLSVLLAFLSCGAAELAYNQKIFDTLDSFFYDSWHQFAGLRYEPEHVVIVTIDDQDLLEHKDEPLVFWGPHFARAIEVLHQGGAKVIGVDFLFSISAESWLNRLDLPENELSRTFDIPMRTQLNTAPVVLTATAAINDKGESEIILPVIGYIFSLPNNYADIGLANFYPDEDGVVRHFLPALFEDGREPRLTLAALLAKRAMDEPAQTFSATPQTIGFVGPPGTVPRISLRELLAPDAENDKNLAARIRNRVAIIGGEHSGANDIHLTPYIQRFFTGNSKMMTGPELHANIVETMLTGIAPQAVPRRIRLLALALISLAATLLFFNFSPTTSFGILIIFCLALTGTAYLLFLKYWILPVLQAPVALGVSYIGTIGLRLTREERTRAHLQKAIGPYVSSEIVDQVLESGKLPDLGGETLGVTVLFSDIRSFTTISEKLAPHEVVEMLNTYFSRACEPILNQGGMVDKFIGDAVMAVFGAPIHHPDHAKRAVIAALEMVKEAESFRAWLLQKYPDRGLPEFRIGVGLHTGDAVIGNIGSTKRMGYTAIGDAVNIASRLEGQCKNLGWTIVASKDTLDAAGVDVVTGGQEEIQPRGREGTLQVYEVLDFIQ